MNLADMLAYTDIHQLSRIAKHYECECSVNSKNELIQSILSIVNRRDIFEQMVNSLPVEDLRFMNTILFDKRDAFSLEELLAWAKQTKFTQPNEDSTSLADDWNPRDTIAKFKQRGWLFNGHSQQTKYLFTVPKDLKRKISDSMAKQLQTSLEYTSDPGVYRDEHDFLLSDVLRFLKYINDNDVVLTADGFIYKRQLLQVLQSLHVEEQLVGKGGWRFGYGRKFKEYPNRFSLLYDYCYYQQYIDEEKDRLLLSARGNEILKAGKKDSLLELYRFWVRLYKGPIRNMQALAHWVSRLADERWTSVDSLKQTLCPFIKPYYYDSADSILEQRVLTMMMHLGLLRMGQHESSGYVVRMTKLGIGVVQGTYIEEQDRIELPDETGR